LTPARLCIALAYAPIYYQFFAILSLEKLEKAFPI